MYKMIVDERTITYLHSLELPESDMIEKIEQEALESHVPIIRKETQSFLKVLLLMKKPLRMMTELLFLKMGFLLNGGAVSDGAVV